MITLKTVKPGEGDKDIPEPPAPTESTEVENAQGSSEPSVTAASTTEPSPTPPETQPSEGNPLERVTLKGWEADRKGTHTIHTQDGIYNFVNGESEVSSEKAEGLRKAGFIE